MEKTSIAKLVLRRQYDDLEKRADEYIQSADWKRFLTCIKKVRSKGKARDALVNLLQLEAVGGTDSDVFEEFSSLEGISLTQIRASARDHAIGILKEQVKNRHTYFLDVEAMVLSPFAILVKDIIDARKKELEELGENPSRIEVLGTYYGFSILMIEGSKPRDTQSGYGYYRYYRRTWLDEKITESAANAVKNLTGELAKEVDMDKTYRTLGSSSVFKRRCNRTTADILANAVRLALYKVPGNRGTAARALGQTGDSRTLPFLHHRLSLEQNQRVRISIAKALGMVGHESSIKILKERADIRGRYLSKEGAAVVDAIGGIYSPQCRATLMQLLRVGGNTVIAAAIQALAKQDSKGLVEVIEPYLVHRSRPVSRASVLALIELGKEGRSAVRNKAPLVIKKIGYDKPSRAALVGMLGVSGVAQMKPIHQYFAKYIGRLETQIRNWRRWSNSRSYSYYWNRREITTKQKLADYLSLAAKHLRPPFDEELISTLKGVLLLEDDSSSLIRALGQSQLKQALAPKQARESNYLQTFLSSFR